MRTREEIKIKIPDDNNNWIHGFEDLAYNQKKLLEVLLDMRDLLANPPK